MNAETRRRLTVQMQWCVDYRARIHYPAGDLRSTSIADIRSELDLHRRVLAAGGLTIDCSQFVTALLLAEGCRNPNGAKIDGYTGTLLEHLPVYSDPRNCDAGALIVFGAGTGHHVAIVHTPDPRHGNPLCCENGDEQGPDFATLDQIAATQIRLGAHGYRCLSIQNL